MPNTQKYTNEKNAQHSSNINGKSRINPNEDVYDESYFDLGACGSYKQCYEDYIEDLSYPDMIQDIVNTIKPQRVLDIGCALGRVVEMFHNRGIDAHGVDISEYAISKARKNIRNKLAKVNVENEKISIPDAHFDFIIYMAVIEHLHNDTNLLNEMNRLATNDGIIYITTPPRSYKPSWNDKTYINLHDHDFWIKRFNDFEFDVKPLKMYSMYGYAWKGNLGGTYRRVKSEIPTSNLGKKIPRPLWIFTVSFLKFIRNSILFKRNRYIWAYILTKKANHAR
jgi:2-polyprenyl-3-methyl-5-hydroxy-6-metoxy-1,4-benzoquinol methylase